MEGLKKKWLDRAGDRIVPEGRAEYADFVEFVWRVEGRLNNRYVQEVILCQRKRKERN